MKNFLFTVSFTSYVIYATTPSDVHEILYKLPADVVLHEGKVVVREKVVLKAECNCSAGDTSA